MQIGRGCDQRFCRLGLWVVEYAPSDAAFDDLSFVHDQHLVGDRACDGEIMRDEEISHAEPMIEVGEQVQHLGTDRNVQR